MNPKQRHHAHLRLAYDAARAKPPELPPQEATVDDEEFTRHLMALNFGPRCSGWLAWKHRALIKRRGYFVLRIATSEKMPMWCALAIRYFKHLEKRWTVEERSNAERRLFVVSYVPWGKRRTRPSLALVPR